MHNKKLQLSRMAILRKEHFFQIVTPSGGVYELDEASLRSLLMIGKGIIPDRREVFNLASEEYLVEETSNQDQPFDIDVVLGNLKNKKMSILTLSDLAILVTRKCNYRCRGCSVSAPNAKTEEKPLSFWKNILSDARKFGALNLAISGGEPIMPQTIEKVISIINYAKESGFKKIVVASNGSYMPKYAHNLKEAGVERVSLSYYPQGNYGPIYTRCSKARYNFLQAAKAINVAGIDLRLNCVVTRPMISMLDKIVEDALQMMPEGNSYMRFSPLIEVGDAKSLGSFHLSSEDYMKLLKMVIQLKVKYQDKFRLTCDEHCDLDDPVACDAGMVYALVNEKGDVSACDLLEGLCPVGNISDTSFFNIWNESSRWVKYRSIDPINKKCQGCSVTRRKICFGKCRALSYIRFGSLNMNEEGGC